MKLALWTVVVSSIFPLPPSLTHKGAQSAELQSPQSSSIRFSAENADQK